MPNAPLLAIVGETASGKSDLGLTLAERLNGEIICADSWTVYKGFDIGSAKPSAEERARVRHHLLDVADPREGFSAVLFQRLAKQAISDIAGRGKLPIIVGGTGLYVDSVLYDYSFLPPSDPSYRKELEALTVPELLDRAVTMGLDISMIDTRNKRRIIRLIENAGALPSRKELRANTMVCGLRLPREVLRRRVEARVEAMVAAGLEQEVTALAQTYGWDVEPMKGIGYREWRPYFEGVQTLAEVRARIVKSTMDLAKRQRTWFKRNNSIHWLDYPCETTELVDIVTTVLNK